MINIGCNYLFDLKEKNKWDALYQEIINRGYIHTLKYPGRSCTQEDLQYFLKIAKKTNCNIDIHGLPNMIPKTHSLQMQEKINWNSIPEELFTMNKSKRMSTHIGLEDDEKNIDEKLRKQRLSYNIKKLKQIIKQKFNQNIEFGGENQSGGFGLSLKEISPEFISEVWSQMDFGVFDITHAKLAAKDLNISYSTYIDKLKNKDKVKILHVSGNTDKTNQYKNKVDKHFMIDEEEIEDIIKTINIFSNIDLVITEYAYNSKYSLEKELIIEVLVLNTIIKTMNVKKSKEMWEYLNRSLNNDCLNTKEILKEDKLWKIL